jgi:urease accessory protein
MTPSALHAPQASLRRKALLASLLLLPLVASAHPGHATGGAHSFVDGWVHPFTGLDHLAAMLGVGLWSGLSARRAGVAPLAFASLLLIGALLASAGLQLPAVEPMIASSLLVIGLLLARRQSLPPLAAAGLVGGFALFHGAAHGQELGAGPALLGMVVATASLHLAGLAAGRWPLAARPRGQVGPAQQPAGRGQRGLAGRSVAADLRSTAQ